MKHSKHRSHKTAGYIARETVSAGVVLDTLRDAHAEEAERKRRVALYAASMGANGKMDWSVVTGGS